MPRAGLTTDKVVREAAVVADDNGWERLSLAAVAERFGVRLPSLYKHIASVEVLRESVAALATQELADELTRACLGRSGPAALRAVCDAYRDYARRHPGRYAATIRAPRPDNARHVQAAEQIMRVVLAVLEGYGVTGDDAVDAVRALRAALHGFVVIEAGGGYEMPQDVDRSFRRMVNGLDTTFAAWRKTLLEAR